MPEWLGFNCILEALKSDDAAAECCGAAGEIGAGGSGADLACATRHIGWAWDYVFCLESNV